jgi:hypothetical protein
MILPRAPKRGDDVRQRPTRVGAPPTFGRGKHLVRRIENRFEILLVDDVLGADLLSSESSEPYPAPDRFRIPSGAPRSFGHGHHVAECYYMRSKRTDWVRGQRALWDNV